VKIHDELQPLAVPIDGLNPYYKNPRRGAVPVIKESLEANGQYRAIVVNRGTHTGRPNEILGGNHTWKAAVELGATEIAATWVDCDDTDCAKIVAVDNRSNDQAWYDERELAALLTLIAVDDPSLLGTGYNVEDLKDLYYTLDEPLTFQETEGTDARLDETKGVGRIICPDCGHGFSWADRGKPSA